MFATASLMEAVPSDFMTGPFALAAIAHPRLEEIFDFFGGTYPGSGGTFDYPRRRVTDCVP